MAIKLDSWDKHTFQIPHYTRLCVYEKMIRYHFGMRKVCTLIGSFRSRVLNMAFWLVAFWGFLISRSAGEYTTSLFSVQNLINFHRYGDKTPKSIKARLFSVLWIMIGITFCSILTATLSSALTNVTVERNDVLAAKKVWHWQGRYISCYCNASRIVYTSEESKLRGFQTICALF